MKKRLLSALLALALVFVLLPTTALADTTPVTDENVKINGTAVTVGENVTIPSEIGSGTYSYDNATHTLTLNNATITTTGNIGISFGVPVKGNIDYKIELIGTNTISSTSAQAIYVEHDTSMDAWAQETMKWSTFTINGSAGSSLSLSVSSSKEAIESKGAFTLSGGTTVTAASTGYSSALNVGHMTIDNSTLIASSKTVNTAVSCNGLTMKNNGVFEATNSSGGANPLVANAIKGDWLSAYKYTTGKLVNSVMEKDTSLSCKSDAFKSVTKPYASTAIDYLRVENGTAPIAISTITVTGLTRPVTGETPVAMGSVSLTPGLTVADITWGPELPSDGKFAANTSYTAHIKYTVDAGYILATDAQCQDISAAEVVILNKSESQVDVTFSATNTSTPTPALEKSNVYVAGTNLYKNTAYTIQNGKPVMGGTYPGNYNIYFDATDYVLHVKDANIDARGTTGIYGTSDIVFEGKNSITASTYGIYSYFKSSDLKISGTGSLEVKTIAGDPAIATAYDTSRSIIISGNDFTVTADTSETTSYAIKSDKDLTITGGAAVIAKSNATRAIDIKGDLTVANGSLTATSTSDSVPTVQVGGNASFTGSTVTITNNSTTQGKSGKNSYEVSTGLYVGGTLDIKNAAKVTSTVIGGNAIYAKGDITISGDNTEVKATNDAYKFSAISTNRTVNISDNSTVKAENLKKHQGDPNGDTDPSTGKTYNPCPAIAGKIANKNSQNKLHIVGFTTSSAGSQNPTVGTPLYLDIAPSSVEPYIHHYKVTITRGDEVVRTPSPVDIDGHTLLNDTYYTINGSTVDEGTESNYNAFYNSTTKTLKLNNAKISTTTENAAIKISEDSTITTITVTGTNELKGNYNHCIESYDNFTINGTGKLNMTNTNSSSSAASVIHCGPGKSLTIAAEVIIKNEAKPGNLILTVTDNAYSFAEGYNVYASTSVSGSSLETYDAAKSSTYRYLRITKENLTPTTPTPQTPFTIYGIPAQFVDGGMIATTGVTATSSNNINLPIDRVEWYTFTPGFRPDGSMDSVINKTKATGNFEAGKYYVVEIRFVQDLSPFESWDMKVSGWSDNDVSRQSVTARNDIEIYFLTPASAATHEHNWVENYDTVYHWKMCTYDGCTAIKDKALHVWNAWHTSNNEQQHSKSCSECSYSTPPHDIDLAYVSDGEQGHHLYCKHDGCTFVTGTTAHNYEEGSNICTDCGYNKSAPCDHTGDHAYTNNGDGTHKVTCKACGATIVEKQNHEFNPTGVCIYCGATQSGGDPTPDNPGTIVIIRPAEEEKPAQQPNPSTGANDLVGLAVAAAVAAALGSAALLRKHD